VAPLEGEFTPIIHSWGGIKTLVSKYSVVSRSRLRARDSPNLHNVAQSPLITIRPPRHPVCEASGHRDNSDSATLHRPGRIWPHHLSLTPIADPIQDPRVTAALLGDWTVVIA